MSKGTRKPKLLIVGGGKGGVGKSHSSQCISATIVAAGLTPPLVVEFEAAARLTEFYPTRSFHVAVASTSSEELRRRPALAQTMLDPGFAAVRRAMAAGQHVTLDTAANLDFVVADYFNSLMGESSLGEGEDVLYFAVATGEAVALRDAETGIGLMSKALPKATCIAVVNDWMSGNRCEPGSKKFQAFDAAVKAKGAVETVHIDGLLAEDLLAHAKAKKIPLDELMLMSASKVSTDTGMDENDAIRSRRALLQHLNRWVPILQRHAVIP